MRSSEQTWRRTDVGLALVVFAVAQVELSARHPAQDVAGVLRALLLTASTLPLASRRSYPTAVAVTVSAAGITATIASGPADVFYALTAAALLAFYSCGAYAASRSWLGPVVGCASFWAADVAAGHPPSEYIASGVLVLGPWLSGRALRRQRQQSARLRQLAEELAAEKEKSAAAAAAAERVSIAREMHDVVAHGLSVIAVQAEAADAALGVRPALAASAVGTIRSVARESLDEMRRVLRVLHDDDSESGDRAAAPPSLRDLDRLLARFRDSGLRLDVELVGEVGDLSPACDLVAYRVLQEALTNALKHGGTRCRVSVRRTVTTLTVGVCNGLGDGRVAARGSGYGLRGLRDRVEAHRGHLEAGPTKDGWQLFASLPLTATGKP